MTLTTRILLFFLSMLAIVLVGFSTVLYVLADKYLHRQIADRLDSVLNTISAVAETGEGAVEWEPENRNVNLDFSILGDQVVWLVADENGQVVDRSKSGDIDTFLSDTHPSFDLNSTASEKRRWKGKTWEAGQQWIHSEHHSETVRAKSEEEDIQYRALSVTAGASLIPVRTTLGQLLRSLIWLSIGIWLAAFIAGQFVCRRALLPMNRMAVAAREIDADDIAHQRLPSVATNDELEDLNRAFNQLLDRLQEAFERQRRFTGDASHQLRTPLTVILGQVEVALRRERSAAHYRQVLIKVHQQTGHLARMVESLLFLARANSEARCPAIETLELTKWLPRHILQWSGHSRFKDMVCQSTPRTPCHIYAQPALLGELLDILLDNACKYSEPDTAISIRLEAAEDVVSIEVEDQGCGMDDGDLANLFVAFYRSAESRRRGIEGVGLGLSIAKRLAEVFNGTLTVSSRVGRGSNFILKFTSSESISTAQRLMEQVLQNE